MDIKETSELVIKQWDQFTEIIKELALKLDNELEVNSEWLARSNIDDPQPDLAEVKKEKNNPFAYDLSKIGVEINSLMLKYYEIRTTFLKIRETYVHPNRRAKSYNNKFSISLSGNVNKYLYFHFHEQDFTSYIYMGTFLTDKKYYFADWCTCGFEVSWN